MPGGVKLIGTYSPSGSSSVLDITGIPATYTDLMIKYSLGITSGTPTGVITLNNSSSGYNYMSMFNTGSGSVLTFSGNETARWYMQYQVSSANQTFIGNLYIQDYTSAYKKMALDEVASMANPQQIPMMHYWNNTAAVSSIKFDTDSGGNFKSTGVVSIYGISKSQEKK